MYIIGYLLLFVVQLSFLLFLLEGGNAALIRAGAWPKKVREFTQKLQNGVVFI